MSSEKPTKKNEKVNSTGPTTRSKSSERLPNVRPSLPNVSSVDISAISTVIRDELKVALNSDECRNSFITLLIPAIVDAVKEKLCTDIHDALQLELLKKQNQIDKAESEIQSLKQELSAVKESLENQEQYSRRNCLRIYGIKEAPNESTDNLVVDLARKSLKTDITLDHIDRSHRITPRLSANGGVPPHQTPRPKPIIVKFSSYNVRSQFYRARTLLKGSGIFINEDLTPQRQTLFARVRSHPSVKRSWTLDGRIFAIDGNDRKHVILRVTDLEKL